MDMRKAEVGKWKNGVGGRIDKKLKNTLEKIGYVVQVELYGRSLGEYIMRLKTTDA